MAPKGLMVNGQPSPCNCRDGMLCATVFRRTGLYGREKSIQRRMLKINPNFALFNSRGDLCQRQRMLPGLQ